MTVDPERVVSDPEEELEASSDDETEAPLHMDNSLASDGASPAREHRQPPGGPSTTDRKKKKPGRKTKKDDYDSDDDFESPLKKCTPVDPNLSIASLMGNTPRRSASRFGPGSIK